MAAKLESIYLTEARVYIAGVLMPVLQVTITATFNKPPQAELILPAYSELLYMGERDRIPVHVFVRETMVESPKFILLFEGFISETTYVNSAMQRSIGITAISHFDILNDIQVKFMTQLEDMFDAAASKQQDIYTFITANKFTFPEHLFRYGIVKDGSNLGFDDVIRFPSDYLQNIYGYIQNSHPPLKTNPKDIHGKAYTSEPPRTVLHASALTEYFGKQGQWLRLLDRFVRLPYFDEPGKDGYAWKQENYQYEGPDGKTGTVFPMVYGIQQDSVIKLLSEEANNAAPNQSMMELLMFLIEEMEYEYLFITNPAYHGATVPAAVEKVANIISGKSDGNTKIDKLVSSCVKPLLNEAMPPHCNIMYRSLVDNISIGVAHKGVPTRVLVHNTYSQLERLTGNTLPSYLKMYGLIDYYPSEAYPDFDPSQVGKKYLKFLGSEMLEDERFTGPWVRQLHTPRWFHVLSRFVEDEKNPLTLKCNGEDVNALKVFKERFFRRQLISSKYFYRQMQAQCMFDPYITPGFPGVVFDSGDSSFVFAGHVITVVHTLSPGVVNTQVAMNFVRPLHEATTVEIPNPLSSIHDVTHNKDRLSEIYQKILGSNAERFDELEKLVTGTTSETNPNNNPSVAYGRKRRNICTFEDYVNFMGFGVEYGDGPEGPQTPIRMTGEWLENRYDLPVYSTSTLTDTKIPRVEQNMPKPKQDFKNSVWNKVQLPANLQSSSVTVVAPNSGNQTKQPVQIQDEVPTVTKVTSIVKVKVCSLLRAIAKREFARVVYK